MPRKDAVEESKLIEDRKPDITYRGDLGTIEFHFIDKTLNEVKLGKNEIRADFLRREAV